MTEQDINKFHNSEKNPVIHRRKIKGFLQTKERLR